MLPKRHQPFTPALLAAHLSVRLIDGTPPRPCNSFSGTDFFDTPELNADACFATHGHAFDVDVDALNDDEFFMWHMAFGVRAAAAAFTLGQQIARDVSERAFIAALDADHALAALARRLDEQWPIAASAADRIIATIARRLNERDAQLVHERLCVKQLRRENAALHEQNCDLLLTATGHLSAADTAYAYQAAMARCAAPPEAVAPRAERGPRPRPGNKTRHAKPGPPGSLTTLITQIPSGKSSRHILQKSCGTPVRPKRFEKVKK
jgi:hypothetical protein